MMLRLSVIVPVYNVEKYIRPCIESIYKQGLEEDCFEVIIINDGTKDRSMEIIADIINSHSNITVINQENQGLSVARNNGISLAKGEYIIMPDSDDLLIENSLNPLLDKAIETKVDLVVADFLKMNDEEIEGIKNNPPQHQIFTYQEKTGEQLFLEDLNPNECYVWRTIFRKDFIIENKLSFVPGIYYQDVPFTHTCYLKAEKAIRTPLLLNIYRIGHDSVTSSFNSSKVHSFAFAIHETWKLSTIPGLSHKVFSKIQDDVWTSFRTLIRLICLHLNHQERVTAIDILKQAAPDLYFDTRMKRRITLWLYNKMPHSFIHLRYIYKCIVEDRLLPFYYHRIR